MTSRAEPVSPHDGRLSTIDVTELGESVRVKLRPADADCINAVGRGDEGAIFPARPPRKKPFLTASAISGGAYEVSAQAVVGFVPLPSGGTLRVNSKIGSRQGVLWLLFRALKLDASLLRRLLALPAERDSVLEWLFEFLRLEVRKLVQTGLRKDYVPVEETSGYVRGRILPMRTIAETRGLAHQVTCLYDDFTADIFDNQVLRLALRASAAASPELRHSLLGTDALLDGEVTFEKSDLLRTADELKRRLDQQHPGRKSYIPAHTMAYLVLRLLSAGGDGRAWRQPGVLLNMSKLFELALKNMLESEFGYARFAPKGRVKMTFGPARMPSVVKGMRPDIRLPRLIVDAKYKKTPLILRKERLEPPDSDVFQAHTYSHFGERPCALVYAVGSETEHKDTLARGLHQEKERTPHWPRVGLFGFDLSGSSFVELEQRHVGLIRQLEEFTEGDE